MVASIVSLTAHRLFVCFPRHVNICLQRVYYSQQYVVSRDYFFVRLLSLSLSVLSLTIQIQHQHDTLKL